MSFENFVRRTIRALSETGLEYVIVGGLAAILYGRLRATVDVDVVINLQPSETGAVERLVSAFGKHDLDVVEHEIISSLNEKSHFSVFDRKSPLRVDAKGVYTSLDSTALKNRRMAKLLGLDVWVASPEDVVIAKLIYGSPQDIEDSTIIILNLMNKLDFKYLNHRAAQEKVHNQLKKILEKLK